MVQESPKKQQKNNNTQIRQTYLEKKTMANIKIVTQSFL